MAKGVWIRTGSWAVPADERSLEFLRAQKDGTSFIADTKRARNAKQLALWWCLCKLLADQMDMTDEKVSDDLKVALGHADTYVNRDGTIYIKPKSIAFESLPQEEFNSLFKAAVNTIARWLETAPDNVMAQFNSMVADKRYEGMRR